MIFNSKTKLFVGDLMINASNYQDLIHGNHKTPLEETVFSFLRDFTDSSSVISLHTSGTTGTPKSFCASKERLIVSAKMTGQYFSLKEGDTALLSLPLTYIAGKMMMIRALTLGLELYIVSPSSNPILENQLAGFYDFAPFVPLQMETMLNHPSSAGKLQGIKQIILGGAPISSSLLKSIASLNTNVYETFGMTETFSHVAVKKITNSSESYSFFQALHGISFYIDNRECLVIHAPQLLDEDLITNDLVELFSPTSFLWKGRVDNVINSGGIKIFPELLETAIEKLVDGNFFIGSLPDSHLGEKMILVIEKTSNNLNLDWLKKEMKVILPPHHLPKEIIVLPEFKHNGHGKILKQEMLKEIRDKMTSR